MATNPPAAKPANVDEYIAAAPEVGQPMLQQIRAILVEVAPDAVESLKWSQPAYARQRILYCFAGYKDHANFMPTPDTIDAFREEAHAAGCTTTRVVLQIPYDAPLPTDLIRRMAEHRVRAEAAGGKFAV